MSSDLPQPKNIQTEQSIDPQLYKDRILRDFLYNSVDNRSGRKILVYGPKVIPEIEFDNQAYVAPNGWESRSGWDFDGFFLPAGSTCKIKREDGSIRTIDGPGALKYSDINPVIGSVILTATEDGQIESNVEPSAYLGSNDGVNWFIPDGRNITLRWTQADVDAYVPAVKVPNN